MLPSVCNDLLIFNNRNEISYEFRQSEEFFISTCRTDLRKSSFTVRCPTYWNSIPAEIRSLNSTSRLKNDLRTFLINKY